jgi:hypothetical protein
MEVEDTKPAKLQKSIDIPLQPKPQPAASTNGETVTESLQKTTDTPAQPESQPASTNGETVTESVQKTTNIPVPSDSQPAAQPSPEPEASANGETVIGKRKREGSSDLTNDHNAKRVASASVNEPIVLDDDDEGAILID